MEERHYSLAEVAELLGVSERTIRRWIKSGKLRAYKPGRDYRIAEGALRELMEVSEVPKGQSPLFESREAEQRRDEATESEPPAREYDYWHVLQVHREILEKQTERWLHEWDSGVVSAERGGATLDTPEACQDFLLSVRFNRAAHLEWLKENGYIGLAKNILLRSKQYAENFRLSPAEAEFDRVEAERFLAALAEFVSLFAHDEVRALSAVVADRRRKEEREERKRMFEVIPGLREPA